MFGWGKKKEAPPARPPPRPGARAPQAKSGQAAELAALGLDPDVIAALSGGFGAGDDEDAAALEAEFRALQGEIAPKKKAAAPAPARQPDMGALLAGNLEVGDVELTEADLKDPQLLAELRAIGGHLDEDTDMPAAKPAPVPAPAPTPSPRPVPAPTVAQPPQPAPRPRPPSAGAGVAAPAPAAVDAMKVDDEEIGEVELTEEDFQDPALMAEFSAIAGESAGAFEPPPPKPAAPARPPSASSAPPTGAPASIAQPSIGPSASRPTPAAYKPPAPQPPPRRPESSGGSPSAVSAPEPEPAPTRPDAQLALVTQRRNEYLSAAAQAKKKGDVPTAVQFMKAYKDLGVLLEPLELGVAVNPASIPPPPGSAAAQTPTRAEANVKRVPSGSGSLDSKKSSSSILPKIPNPLARPPRESPGAKPAPGAMRGSPSVPAQAKKAPQSPPQSRKATAPPSMQSLSPSVSLEDQQLAEIAEGRAPRGISPAGDDAFGSLQTRLQQQADDCLQYAKAFLQQGDKTRAAEYARLRKEFEGDIVLVKLAKARGKVPATRTVEHTVERTRCFPELKESDMELVVLGYSGMPKEAVDNGATITFEFAFPSDNPQSGSLPAVKSANQKIEYVKMLQIDRRRQPKFIVRRAVEFTMGYKTFFKAKTMGVAKVALADFTDKCEIHTKAEFLDEHRKRLAAYVEVRIRLRTPLEKTEAVQETHRWIRIEPDSTTVAAATPSPPAPSTPAPTPITLSTPATPVPSAASGVSGATLTPIAAAVGGGLSAGAKSPKPAGTPTLRTPEPDDDDEGDPDDITLIMQCPSNEVLEYLQKKYEQQIAQLQAAGKPVPEDLTDRKDQAVSAMNLLVTRIGAGLLSEEAYLGQLRSKVAEEKALAVRLSKRGKTDWAKEALIRAKLMMNELRSVNPDEPEIKPAPQPAAAAAAAARPAAAPQTPTPPAQQGAGATTTTPSSTPTTTAPTPVQRATAPQAPAAASASPAPAPAPAPVPQPRPGAGSPPANPAIGASAKAPTAQAAAASPSPKLSADDDEGNPDDVFDYVSYEVLGWVIAEADKEMASLKTRGLPVPPELVDRKEQATTKQGMIGMQIQFGTLSVEQYTGMLKARIASEKALAVRLKKAGNIPWALLALKRAQIMEKELEEGAEEE